MFTGSDFREALRSFASRSASFGEGDAMPNLFASRATRSSLMRALASRRYLLDISRATTAPPVVGYRVPCLEVPQKVGDGNV